MVMEVSAAVDLYTVFTGTDDIESIKTGERMRGSICMTLPLDKVYAFSVKFPENGEVIADTDTPNSATLKDMKLKQPATYDFIEAAAFPVEKEPVTPGFNFLYAIVAVSFASFLTGKRVHRK